MANIAMATYTVDQIMACLDDLDLEPVLITSRESKKTIQARVAYAVEGNGNGKLKGLVVLVPDKTSLRVRDLPDG
jgi:hypothetical protein